MRHRFLALLTLLTLTAIIPVSSAAAAKAAAPKTIATKATPDQPYRVAATPEWVVAREFRRDYAASDNYPAVLLLSDRQVRLAEQKQDYQRYVVLTSNVTGVRQMSQIRVSFNPAYQKLTIHRVLVHRGDVTRDATKEAEFRLLQREERLSENIQDGYVTAVAVMEDIRVGDIIDFSYSISGSNPIFAGRYFGASDIDGGMPTDRVHIRVSAQAGRPALNIKVFNDDAVPVQTEQNGWKIFEIQRENLPAVPAEDGTPPWHTPYAWVEFSEFRDWPDVTQWAVSLYRLGDDNGAAFTELQKRLHRESKDKADYIIRALRFVQHEVRYQGMEFGENSHRPRAPSETLTRRLGDCKDKSQLLVALLRREGISAWPALVATEWRRGIAKSLPSPGAFDHVIVAVELAGRRYFVDGTRLYDGGDLNSLGRSNFDLALLIGHPQTGLVTMYDDNTAPLLVEQFDDYYASDFSSPVRYEVRTVYHGNQANYQRYLFNAEPLNDIQRRYHAHYLDVFGDVEPVGNLTVNDDINNNRFEVRESWLVSKFWKADEKQMAAPVRVLAFTDILTVPRQRVRQTPWGLSSRSTVRSVTNVHFPMSMPLAFPLEPKVIQKPAFRYTYTDYATSKIYTHVAELETLKEEIPAADIAGFVADRKALQDEWEFSIYSPLPGTIGYEKIEQLRQQVRLKGAP